MRPDVKLGIVVSAVFVTVAGTYFLVQDRRESAIEVNSDPAAMVSGDDKASPKSATTRSAKPVARQASRTATRRDTKTIPPVNQKTNATPRRVQNASRQDRLATDRGAKRSTPVKNQRRRSPGAKQPQRKQPKPQLSLTATPASATDTGIERHRVQQGDTMASLAKQYYGSSQFEAFLVSRNKQLAVPARPRVGEVVNIVPRSTDRKSLAAAPATVVRQASKPATREYRIKSGDSFYRIARDVLGDAKRWNELFEMNKKIVGNDPAKLQIGQVIVLPQK